MLIASLVVSSAAGCSAGAGSGGNTDTLLIDTSFVYKTLDPARTFEPTGALALHSLYSSLVTFDGADITTPVPNLAESFVANADNTEFTFVLREGAKFSDGTPVTSKDVLFSYDRITNLKSSASALFTGLSFSAPDERHIIVTSKEPKPTLPVLLAMPSTGILNSATAAANGANSTTDAVVADTAQTFLDSNSVGSGPYKLERNDPGSEIVLVANDQYWGQKPDFTRVVIRNTDTQAQKLSMIRADAPELALDLTGNLLDGLPDSLNVSMLQDTIYYTYANADPTVSTTTSNPAFAEAFKSALDYPGIAALYGQGGGQLGGLVAPVLPGALPTEEGPREDIAKARDLVQKNGFGTSRVDFSYPAITYRGVDLGTIATKIQSDVARAGIDLQLTPLSMPAFLEKNRAGKAEMAMSPQSLTYPRAESLVQLMSPGGINSIRAGWTDRNASAEAIAASNAFLDNYSEDGRVTAVEEWQRVMAQDSPFIPLAVNSGSVVSTPTVSGADYTAAPWSVDIASVKAS
ncbi:hypothetical protein JCM9803A_01520 [Rhodococcus erythropolis]